MPICEDSDINVPLINTMPLEHCHSEDEVNKSGMTLENKQAIKKLGLACFLVTLFIISECIGEQFQFRS